LLRNQHSGYLRCGLSFLVSAVVRDLTPFSVLATFTVEHPIKRPKPLQAFANPSRGRRF
jgi:hypothetical protein